MSYYYDRQGNMYKIEDEKVLKKKDVIEVFSESGEEFGLPVKVADEFRLTPDERAQAVADIRARIADLARAIGLGPLVGPILGGGGGCPVIDPAQLQSVVGTQVLPQQSQLLANLLRVMPGGGCPNIDPANLGTVLGSLVQLGTQPAQTFWRMLGGGCPVIDPVQMQPVLGTQILPQQYQFLTNLLRVLFGGGCPNIDPANLGTVLGSVVQPRAAQAAEAPERKAAGGCPNIDPTDLGSVLGSLVQLGPRQTGNIFERIFGGGCPMIDPYQVGTLMGTLGLLRGLQGR